METHPLDIDSLTQTVAAIAENPGGLTGAGMGSGVLTSVAFLVAAACISAAAAALQELAAAKTPAVPRQVLPPRVLRILQSGEKWQLTLLFLKALLYIAAIIPVTGLLAASFPSPTPPAGVVLLFVIGLTLLLLLVCEIVPRSLASKYPVSVAAFMALPVTFLNILFTPLSALLLWLVKIFRNTTDKPQGRDVISDLAQAIEDNTDEVLTEEKEIFEGIAKFGNKNVSEIMTPRVDVVALDINTPFPVVLDTINSSGYSRIPVYSDSFDQVRGILYIKDLLPHTGKDAGFRWQELLRPPFFIPENKKVKDLLEDFQKNKIHMAVVVDEYGGSPGIVTLEDVLEEIVGDIADEFDEDEVFFDRLGENKFLFSGKTPLEKFAKAVDCPEDYFDQARGEADTLAGLLLEIRGEIPVKSDTIVFKKFRFTIESVTNRRIQQVKVEMLDGTL